MKLFLFFFFPALELYCLVKAGAYIGGLGVVLAVIASMAFGGWIVQTQGRQSLTRVQGELQSGRAPQETLLDNLLVFFAGLLFIIPGFISDALGLLLLIPPVRGLCARKFITYFTAKQQKGQAGFQGSFVYYGRNQSGYPEEEAAPQRESGAHETIIDCTAEPVSPSSTAGEQSEASSATSQSCSYSENNNEGTARGQGKPPHA